MRYRPLEAQVISVLITCVSVGLLIISGMWYLAGQGRWDLAALESVLLLAPVSLSYWVVKDHWIHVTAWDEHEKAKAEEKETRAERMQQAKEMTDNMMRMAATARAMAVSDLDEPESKH